VPAGILTDLTKCIDCKACVWACKDRNALPREDGAAQLSATTWTCLERHGGTTVRRQCMHCLDPACASVCPVGALKKTPDGAVVYHAERCIGCRYCMVACPFSIPKYEWDKSQPLVRKCQLCHEKRRAGGRQPACTSVCPTGATRFGERDRLLEEARQRIRNEPDRYVDHIYGLSEAGGTSVLYLSSVPFGRLGFQVNLQVDPYPRLTWSVLSKLPNVVGVGGVLLVGIWWIIRRRQELSGAPPSELTLERIPADTPKEGDQ